MNLRCFDLPPNGGVQFSKFVANRTTPDLARNWSVSSFVPDQLRLLKCIQCRLQAKTHQKSPSHKGNDPLSVVFGYPHWPSFAAQQQQEFQCFGAPSVAVLWLHYIRPGTGPDKRIRDKAMGDNVIENKVMKNNLAGDNVMGDKMMGNKMMRNKNCNQDSRIHGGKWICWKKKSKLEIDGGR